ncbi:Sulfotransferase 1C4-like 3 [Homarus americanus]|uniref:Sulfotransferase 1C4-like 3 n=1 Tax=Homarus americanus TaxID=6706 RepID=A0A8J5MPJ6_HOMAM|nr:Sulfotransferase 1C4-like 3 [Homarus americanus]
MSEANESLLSGHKATPLEGEDLAQQDKNFIGFTHGLVRLTPGGWFLPSAYTNYADKIYNFQVVWTMRNNPDLDNPLATTPILSRVPIVDMDMLTDGKKMPPITPDNPLLQGFLKLCPGANPADGVNLQVSAAMPDPRVIKSHLPFSLLHPTLLEKAKVVYIARNPRDMVVSLYHHCRLINNFSYSGTLDQFIKYVVARHTSFSEMQARDNLMGSKSSENPMMNPDIVKQDGGFFRKGEVGSWKEKLTTEMVEKLDQWIKKNLNQVPFKYTLGHKIKYLGEKEMAKLKSDFTGCGYQDLLRLSPGRWLYPRLYMKYADKLYNFEFKQSDVLVMTYPKCGTTWVQEVVWTMLNNPDLKHSKTHQPIMYRSPFLELDMFTDLAEDGLEGVMIKLLETTPDPRTIKTHLPLSLMPSSLLNTTKVVYVARNPKDVVTSYYHHCRITKLVNYKSSLEQFVRYFVDDNVVYGPYWLHVKEAWEKRQHPNLHFLFYEDLKTDTMAELGKLNDFLGTMLTENQLERVAIHTSFDEMKTRKALLGEMEDDPNKFNLDIISLDGGFFRKGDIGDWQTKLTPPMEDKINKWIEDNLNEIGITFKFSN